MTDRRFPIHCRNTAEFLKVMAEMSAAGGAALHTVILHDPECTPSVCRCEPEYVIEELTVDNYIRGQEAQAKWVRETVS